MQKPSHYHLNICLQYILPNKRVFFVHFHLQTQPLSIGLNSVNNNSLVFGSKVYKCRLSEHNDERARSHTVGT